MAEAKMLISQVLMPSVTLSNTASPKRTKCGAGGLLFATDLQIVGIARQLLFLVRL